MSLVRMGLIGCGGIAMRAHLPAMRTLRDRVTLVAAADLNRDLAEKAAAPWGAAAYVDYREMLRRDDLDAVMIATPEFAHQAQVEAAAAAGRHVLCEKPMANSLAEADAMLGACQRAGVLFMVAHSRRFTRRYMEVRAAIDRGDVGTVRLVRENERRPRPQAGHTRYYTPEHWSGNPTLSHGAVLSNGVHEMDLLRWFTGGQAVAVLAEHRVTVATNTKGAPDFITITIRFANGAIASAEVHNNLPQSYPAFHQCEVYGSRGAIRAKDLELAPVTRYAETGAEFPAIREVLLHNSAAYTREWAAFLDAVEGRAPLPMPATEARAALELALAASESARTGETVRLAGARA